ncbi:hypothetical protein ACFLWU_00670 [Chloroflexota bacterium]
MESANKYIPGTSHLVDYAIEHFDAEVISVEKLPEKRPPFPCLTGAHNTSNSYEYDKNLPTNILAVGTDTLELNFGIEEYRQPDMFKTLDIAQDTAVSAGYKGRLGEPVEWFGQQFMILARGSKGGYKYLLKNGDIELQMMPDARGGKPSPELRVVFRSPYLWRMGEIPAYNQVIGFLNDWAYIEYCKVSRADLCVDRVMSLPELNRKTDVVTLVKGKDMFYGGDYQIGQHQTGYQFGRGGIACRFYDKTYEIDLKGNGHILPLWEANGWDGITPVSRLELQLRRDGLRRFDLNMDFITFQDSKADIWAYGTGRFLRIINPTTATRKERAKVNHYWQDYQNCAGLFGERQGVIPYKQVRQDWRPLVNQSDGCLAGAWARLAVDVGDHQATAMLEEACEHEIPQSVIDAGLLQKARFAHLS